MKLDRRLTIAIDGYSSCGKSTVAKALAKKLNYIYIDSGAMYRAITLYCIDNNLINGSEVQEIELLNRIPDIHIDFRWAKDGEQADTHLNGKNVEDKIRQIEVSNLVSPVSIIGFVREAMVKLQRELSSDKGVVMDGRDIGTVVFPDADLKVFMTADPDIRAQRRYDELKNKNQVVSLDEIKKNIKQRDYIDSHREISPLRKADDALLLDNSNLSREEQLDWIISKLEERFN